MTFKRGLKPGAALGVGSIENPYIDHRMVLALKKMLKHEPDIIVCGSLGLVINGKLKRQVYDMDILIPYNAYHKPELFFPEYRKNTEHSHSHKFLMGQTEVLVFKLLMGDIKIDVMWNPKREIQYEEVGFFGHRLKIEEPEGAISAKLNYVENDKHPVSFRKHLMDLIAMGISRERLMDSLMKSHKNTVDRLSVQKVEEKDAHDKLGLPW